MLSGEFEFIIASPFDREKLVCEIHYKDEIIAEISQETSELLLEIYPSQKNKYWAVSLSTFQKVLDDAKNHLLGQNN